MADVKDGQRLRVVVIIGLDGSGKSTLAWQLSRKGWAVVQLVRLYFYTQHQQAII